MRGLNLIDGFSPFFCKFPIWQYKFSAKSPFCRKFFYNDPFSLEDFSARRNFAPDFKTKQFINN